MGRIRDVQDQLRRRAEVELSALEHARSDNSAEQLAVISALNDDPHLKGLFVDVTARRLKGLAAQAVVLASQCEVQQATVIELGLGLKRTEKIMGRLVVRDREDSEKRMLAEISELAVARRYGGSDV